MGIAPPARIWAQTRWIRLCDEQIVTILANTHSTPGERWISSVFQECAQVGINCEPKNKALGEKGRFGLCQLAIHFDSA